MQRAIVALLMSAVPILGQFVYASEVIPNASSAAKVKDSDSQPKVMLYGGPCVVWKTHARSDQESLDKLSKFSSLEKPRNGIIYTKNQLIVLLGSNLAVARAALASSKNKLEKTEEGLVDLRDAELTGFDLSGLNLDNADFRGAEMKGANLSNSKLNHAILYKTNLEEANLDYAAINFSNISKANLINAHLCEASLLYTDLGDAVFRGANMKGARLDTAINVPSVMYIYAHSIFEIGLPVPPNYFDQ